MSVQKQIAASRNLEIFQDECFKLDEEEKKEEEKKDIIPFILSKYPLLDNNKDLALLMAFRELSQAVIASAIKNLKINIDEQFSEMKDDISNTENVLFKAAYNNSQHIAYLERHLETATMNDTPNGLAWDSQHP